jgi:hypothetical protein
MLRGAPSAMKLAMICMRSGCPHAALSSIASVAWVIVALIGAARIFARRLLIPSRVSGFRSTGMAPESCNAMSASISSITNT